MPCVRMGKVETALATEIRAWFDRAATADPAEVRTYGTSARGDVVPDRGTDK